uniref:ADP,ATP carrier protein n=1 Tax=Pseudo-nitzschia australis TaxID=44445 RepID=A0A7S4EQV7_9STRA|mmetsp:Transcript_9419/g.20012  ORF Transcript_9419/g.20012 Transcript_9419/m.20012 type:complete len:667 (+) Transcript_9419:107-2107(+)
MFVFSIGIGKRKSYSSDILSPVAALILLASALFHLATFSSVSAVNIVDRPNNSFFHLATALSLVSVTSAIRSSGRSSFGGSSFSASSISTSTTTRKKLSTTTILASQKKLEVEAKGKTEIVPGHIFTANSTLFIPDNTAVSVVETAALTFTNHSDSSGDKKNTMQQYFESIASSPRARSCICMATSMALHFGGYEFARSAALALFTSSETGFTHPSAHPFAIGLVTPTTLFLLYWYGTLLKSDGPRKALRKTTTLVLGVLLLGDGLVALLSSLASVGEPSSVAWLKRATVAVLFVFQNSYAHLIYTQQWSFLGSVMTPTEGTRWFTFIAGSCSLVCTLTASSVQSIADRSYGLETLVFLTCATLGLSMLFADRAYQLSAEHGFDPSRELLQKQAKKEQEKTSSATAGANDKDEESLLAKTGRMFRTSPTLAGLFGEVIAFQSLSTVLNICFVRQLKASMPVDGDRAAFTGQFYAGVNGISGAMQFFILPLLRKYLEPQWIYRFLPIILMPLLTYAAVVPASANSGLWIAAASFFALKSTDYSIRGVATELTYQPLDFDARFLGKEVIGVFANRFGKSGTSMILSALTGMGIMAKGTRPMAQLAVGVGALWSTCSIYLSQQVVTNKQAEERVQQRSGRASNLASSNGENQSKDSNTEHTDSRRTKEE